MKIVTKLRNATSKIKYTMATAAVVLVGAVVPFTASAPASAAISDCGPDRLCVWEHWNGGGAMYYYGGNWHDTCVNVISSWNDRISSIRNNLYNHETVTFYNGANCTGYQSINYPGPTGSGYNIADPFQNDQITSISFW